MHNFLIGKNVWGYVSGEIVMPTDKKAENYESLASAWKVNNSKIITWFNNFVNQSISVHFAKFPTAKEIWEYLERLYF